MFALQTKAVRSSETSGHVTTRWCRNSKENQHLADPIQNKEAVLFFWMSVLVRKATRRHIPRETNFSKHHSVNFRCYELIWRLSSWWIIFPENVRVAQVVKKFLSLKEITSTCLRLPQPLFYLELANTPYISLFDPRFIKIFPNKLSPCLPSNIFPLDFPNKILHSIQLLHLECVWDITTDSFSTT
jgi:hypothetical protein